MTARAKKKIKKQPRKPCIQTTERWMPVIFRSKPTHAFKPFVAFGGTAYSDRGECLHQCEAGTLAQFGPVPMRIILADARHFKVVPKRPARPKPSSPKAREAK